MNASPFDGDWVAVPLWAAIAFAAAQVIGLVTLCLISGYMIHRLRLVVANRYMIADSESFLHGWLCGLCLLMKLSRHIDRAQGYIKYDIQQHN